MSDSTITTERRDHLFLIGLNRADKKNAFNLQMLRELAEAYTTFEEDSGLWCGLLFAHGDHFTTGLDLAEVGPAVASGQEAFVPEAVDPLDLLGRRRTKPIVAVAQGWCITIGIELLLACDIRVVAEGTRFRQMEVNRGIMPFGGATLRLPQVAGWGNAMRYLLTGDEFDAAEALRIGLAQEVTEPGAQLEAATRIAGRVAGCAPLAVQATRAAGLTAVEQGAMAACDGLMEKARGLMVTEDAAEGVRSFVERRAARFMGK